MSMFVSGIAFRRTQQTDWKHAQARLKELFDGVDGLVHNLDSEGPGYAVVSPYGDMGKYLADRTREVSWLAAGYVVSVSCYESDFALLQVFQDGKCVEYCYVGRASEVFLEILEVDPPKMDVWSRLLLDSAQTTALEEALFGVNVFVEDNLRQLSQLTGMPIFDDRLVFEGV